MRQQQIPESAPGTPRRNRDDDIAGGIALGIGQPHYFTEIAAGFIGGVRGHIVIFINIRALDVIIPRMLYSQRRVVYIKIEGRSDDIDTRQINRLGPGGAGAQRIGERGAGGRRN